VNHIRRAAGLWQIKVAVHYAYGKETPRGRASLLGKFDKVWCPHHTICARDDHKIGWC
jgi:hypothetical protein